MKVMKILMVGVILVLLTPFAQSETNFYFFASGNHFLATGTEADYEVGVNEFPLMGAHQTFGLGLGIAFSGKGLFFTGLEFQYNNFLKEVKFLGLDKIFSTMVTLTDPSDNDTLEIEAYKNVAGYFTLNLNLIRSTFLTLFLNAGGGVVYVLDANEEKEYTSSYGFDVVISPPEKKFSPAAFGGAGIALGIIRAIAIFGNFRYTYIHSLEEMPRHQTGFSGLVGLYLRF